MPVDFDTVPNRRGTNCFKYDFAREMGMPEDVRAYFFARNMEFTQLAVDELDVVRRARTSREDISLVMVGTADAIPFTSP